MLWPKGGSGTVVQLSFCFGTHISTVALSQIVCEVVLDLADELLGVLGVESQDLTEALEADVLEVTVGQGLHVSIGFDHLLLCQGV